LRKLIVSPKPWLAAGVILFGSSAVLSYHEDQMAANSVLAQKVGLPSEVYLQDFSPDAHTNMVGELQVIAEIDVDGTAYINVGSADVPHMLAVVPLFAVSRLSQPFATKFLWDSRGAMRRPMPRSIAPLLADLSEATRLLEGQTLGVAVIDLAEGQRIGSLRSLGLSVLGDGLRGPLVRIVGVEIDGDALIGSATEALAKQGIAIASDVPMLSPYSDPRATVLAVRDMTPIRQSLSWAAVLTIFISLVLRIPFPKLFPRLREETIEEVPAMHAFPAVFQPIRTQAEIAKEQLATNGGRPSQRKAISRIVS